MRVVIDSSVLLAAMHRLNHAETVMLFVISRTDIEWVVSPAVRAEYQAVLKLPKFALPKGVLQRWLELLTDFTTLIPVNTAYENHYKRDERDWLYWECALNSQADFFIVADHDFQQAYKLRNTKMLSISLFKQLVCDVLNST